MTITSWLPVLLYAASANAYLAHFARRNPATGRLASGLLGGAVLAHTFLIGMQTMQAGYAPLVGTTAAVAAPTHGRLTSAGAADRPGLMRRLDRADRVRSVGAVVCVVGALVLAL